MSNRVRDSTEGIVADGNLAHVTIDDDRLAAFAERLRGEEFSLPDWRAPVMLDEREEGAETVFDFFLVGNTLNFVFDDLTTKETFTTTYAGESYFGAFAMWASMKRAYENGLDITSGPVLRDLTEEQTRDIFRGDPPIPLLDTRREVLTHIGEQLCEHADGHFHNAVDSDGNITMYDDGDGFVEWLTSTFPKAYRDERTYRGETVYFDKKAQLSMGMVHGRFADSSDYTITDIDSMTIFADYLIPALLREEGVFEYSDELARAVDAEEPIEEGDPKEVEIRIATIVAGERLLAVLNAEREEPLTGFHLDQALWQAGRNEDLVHHFTETITY